MSLEKYCRGVDLAGRRGARLERDRNRRGARSLMVAPVPSRRLARILVCAVLASLPAAVWAEGESRARTSIEAAAARETRLSGTDVEVRESGGQVVLYGTVRLYRQKMLYEQIAWQTEGVRDVDVEIQVVPLMPLRGPEIERNVRAILKDNPRFHGSGAEVRVADGHVHISGVFHEASDVLLLKQEVAEIEGVVAITIEPRFRA